MYVLACDAAGNTLEKDNVRVGCRKTGKTCDAPAEHVLQITDRPWRTLSEILALMFSPAKVTGTGTRKQGFFSVTIMFSQSDCSVGYAMAKTSAVVDDLCVPARKIAEKQL